MNPIFMEVRDVVTEKASEVLFVQRNDVVQDLSPAATDPAAMDPPKDAIVSDKITSTGSRIYSRS